MKYGPLLRRIFNDHPEREVLPVAATTPKLAREYRRKTICYRGHPLSGDNLYIYKKRPDVRYCKACRAINRGRTREVIW